jgi:hypothetical protein
MSAVVPVQYLADMVVLISDAVTGVSSQLIWGLRTRSGGAHGGFSFDLARRQGFSSILPGIAYLKEALRSCREGL